MIKLYPGSNRSFLNKLFHQMASFPACSIARSSASVVDVVTVDCLRDIQSIGPPYNLKTYPSPDRLSGLFAKEASAELSKTSAEKLVVVVSCELLCAEYSIARYLVPYR